MSVVARTLPESATTSCPPLDLLHRFTVREYEDMIKTGVFKSGDRLELLEGWIVEKLTQDPLHSATLDIANRLIRALLPQEWFLRDQRPINTPRSQPEPDLAIVLMPETRYLRRHPNPGDIAVVMEVADSSLKADREYKGRIYAGARIPVYWVINLIERQIEIYTEPRGGKSPAYRQRRDYTRGESVPLIVAGRALGTIAVSELLP